MVDERSRLPLELDPGLHGENILPYVGQDNWMTCDWHGVWVTDCRNKGSYGRIAYRDDLFETMFWVRWVHNPPDGKRESANLVGAENLKLLPVTPEPWF